ncbi:hypothetical protein ACOJBO_00880 [Rhizobium beringeri]
MVDNEILNENVSDFATRLEAMTSDEVFAAMSALEKHGEDDAGDRDETLSRIMLVEEEIERRSPGQMLTPYRDWKKSSLCCPDPVARTTTNETAYGSQMDQEQHSISRALGVTADFDAALEVRRRIDFLSNYLR